MATIKKSETIKRNFSKVRQIPSDLFKLKVATFKKNIAIDSSRPLWDGIEHCHIYRTFDSDGKECKDCSAVGGHKHAMTIEFDDNGNLEKAICGPAFGNKDCDGHIHEIEYKGSDMIETRVLNPEVTKFLAGIKND